MTKHKDGWYIMDRGGKNDSIKKYILRPYETEQEAQLEKASLLKGFDEDNEWHQRLVVKEIKKEALSTAPPDIEESPQ